MICELVLNLDEAEWSVTINGDGSWLDVYVGFTSNSDVTEFDGLTFAWTLTVNGEEQHQASYPPEGTVYVATDQPYLVVERVFGLRPDDECVLALTAENAGNGYADTETFTIPRPEQPNPDCVWNDETKSWDCPEEEVNENEESDDGNDKPV